jgi:transposase
VLFSDETKITLSYSDRRVRVYRPKYCRYLSQFVLTRPNRSQGEAHFWGCISYRGTGPLLTLQVTMNAEAYINVLREMIPEARRRLFLIGVLLQDDNAPCHRAKSVLAYKAQNQITSLDWPPNSPDLNPRESIWDTLKKRVMARNPTGAQHLTNVTQEEWGQIETKKIKACIDSMPRRLLALARSKGVHTKY